MAKTYEALYKSFYSRDLYRDAGLNWKGGGFKLLALLALIFTILVSIVAFTAMKSGLESSEFAQFTNQLPTITYKGGEVSIDKPSPHVISFDEQASMVIDTSDQFAAKTEGELVDWMVKNSYVAVLTRNRLIIDNENKNKIESYDLSEGSKDTELVITREDINEWAGYLVYASLPFMLIFLFAAMYIYFIIKALIYAVIGMLVAKIVSVNLDFNSLQRIAACAIVPMTLIVLLLDYILGISISTFISIIVTIGFLTFGIKSGK